MTKRQREELAATERLGAAIRERQRLEGVLANKDAGLVMGVERQGRRRVQVPQLLLWGREFIDIVDEEEEAFAALLELRARP